MNNRGSLLSFPFLVTLVALLLLLGYYLANCLNKPTSDAVLGVSTFNTSSSKNPVVNGESFTFNTTTVADKDGIANATLKFDLSGQGVIDNNIHGPGTCAKLTDATAVCNNVNIEAFQTANWTVPVTVNSNCSQSAPASLSFQAQLVAPVGTFTSTAGANCVANQPGAGGTNNPTSTPAGGAGAGTTITPTSGAGGTGGTGASGAGGTSGQTGAGSGSNGGGSGNTGLAAGEKATFAGFACSRVGGFPLVFILLILWVIAFVYRQRNLGH